MQEVVLHSVATLNEDLQNKSGWGGGCTMNCDKRPGTLPLTMQQLALHSARGGGGLYNQLQHTGLFGIRNLAHRVVWD